ncbi:T9SS type A sorting domain-containing protein [Bizionia myxarmorum]|uniref:T9SS type A sorting domain-containing protein n=1 Tax=Bizionia myxarmorum TaxID=291186 RepID=A0A5D0RG76_9FLAO|nr:T9SS type A sorting domain-containing protein [Bizionia myxarmorum]
MEKEAMTASENMENLSVYPNPVSNGKLYIATKFNLSKQIIIYNVLGNTIMSETLSGKELNISKIKPGIYIIKITENNVTATRKLIVK